MVNHRNFQCTFLLPFIPRCLRLMAYKQRTFLICSIYCLVTKGAPSVECYISLSRYCLFPPSSLPPPINFIKKGVKRMTTIITFGLNLLHKNQVSIRTNLFCFIADYYSIALICISYMVDPEFLQKCNSNLTFSLTSLSKM